MENLIRAPRTLLAENFTISDWPHLKPYFDELANRKISSSEELTQWLAHGSELDSAISEELGWRYIRMTCYTENEDYSSAYQDFIQNIQPPIAPYHDRLNKKLLATPFVDALQKEVPYFLLLRDVKKEVEIFREKNIPVFTEIETEAQRYGQVCGAMIVEIDEQELTLQQASVILLSTDREKRKSVWEKISSRRLQDKEMLDELFSKLISLRHQVALQADHKNFRDYMFVSLGRFDYSPADCFAFHEAIATEVVPIVNDLAKKRKENLKVESLRPWDKAVDEYGRDALRAFEGGDDLLEKSIHCLTQLDPYFGECLRVMKNMGHLDLVSRKGKAPGGYNYPLSEIGVPFIFMNATSTLRDLTTMVHEAGHALHNFLTRHLPLQPFKSPPMEVAELASMSMELLTMDYWDVFFTHAEDLRRAKREQLEDVLEALPWIATIDQFQHWIYENPGHDLAARKEAWNKISGRFSDDQTDWSGFENVRDYSWQKQLHLYEVPFYYIEYGMAQLGAIAVWRNFKKDKAKGLAGYKHALALGNRNTIPEIYKAAGIEFNFSTSYIRELMQFVRNELEKIS